LLVKEGVLSGYRAFMGLHLETHVAVVVLSNEFDWDERVGASLLLRISCACAAGGIKLEKHHVSVKTLLKCPH
jgi:hypothetical protein